ncbi:MAG: ATPase [Bacteroidota bacterium]|nr:ATPase [Bacteroidota bacterium]
MNMFIVADSGATKTNWSIIDKGSVIYSFRTKGFNPYFINSTTITQELTHTFPEDINQEEIQCIYFYGAGCSSSQTKQIILKGCNNFFPRAKITIESDLLGAAKAIFLNQKGIIAIMGTGSNTGIYNGKLITHQINSLGFALGDEGSGAHLGKLLMIDYLHNNLPRDLKIDFEKKFALSNTDIIYSIYKKTSPSKFLASFTPYIIEKKNHPHVKNLIQQSIQELFEKYICKYLDHKNYSLGFVGSVAYYLKPELKHTAQIYGINIKKIIKEPTEKLIEYHTKTV